MSPHRELIRLQEEKKVLRARIAEQREQFAAGLNVLLRPLRWIDRARAWWTQVGPIVQAIVPPRAPDPPRARGWIAALLRWAPAASAIWRALRAREATGASP